MVGDRWGGESFRRRSIRHEGRHSRIFETMFVRAITRPLRTPWGVQDGTRTRARRNGKYHEAREPFHGDRS
jgi:hypothetical protein